MVDAGPLHTANHPKVIQINKTYNMIMYAKTK